MRHPVHQNNRDLDPRLRGGDVGGEASLPNPTTVIPALVAGIHLSTRSGARGWLDPGHKARDDSVGDYSR